MAALFVTGTGTDVGKTHLNCALLRRLREMHLPAGAIKPIVSGYDEAHPETSDTFALAHALETPWSATTAETLSPWRFAAPLSPDQAARREGRRVAEDALLAFCERAIAAHPAVLIEGAGGVMSPLTSSWLNADLAAALKIPALLVVGGYLGAVGHALAAWECLERRRVSTAALILNDPPDAAIAPEDTQASLQHFLGSACPILPLRRGAENATLDALCLFISGPHHERSEAFQN